MNEIKWEEEREALLERLRKAEQIAAESQAEAAVYRALLEDCYEAARQARANDDISFLSKVNLTWSFTTPNELDVKQWGKYFLDAYMHDASLLRETKKALELIKSDAEELLDDNEIGSELRMRVGGIHKAAKEGLI